jgi:hypothetical protein
MNTAATRTPPEKNVGRVVGVLLLLHLAAGLMVPFMMLHSLVSPPGFLASAAAIPNQSVPPCFSCSLAVRSP